MKSYSQFSARRRPASVRVTAVFAVALALSASAMAQTDIGSLPRVSAPGAYGDAVTTGIAASSSTQRALAPPPGLGAEAERGLTLNVGIGASRHSNPDRRPEGSQSESDVSILFSPSLTWGGEIGRHQYEIGYSYGSESYNDLSTEDSDFERLGGALRLDLTRILIADLYASRTEAEEQRGTAGARDIGFGDDEDEFTLDTLGGRVTLGRRTNRLQVYVGAETNEYRFTNNDQGVRDRDDDVLEAGLFFNVGAATSIFVHATERDIDYLIGNPSLDNTESLLTGGVTWEATEFVSLTVEAGQLDKDYDDPSIEGFDGTTYLGKILWSPRDRTNLSFYISRRTEESAEPDAPFFVSEVAGIDLTQQVGERGSVTLHYAQAEDEYDNGRVDEIDDYGIAFGYSAFQWLDVGLGYNVVDKRSTEPEDNFEDEIWSLFVNFKPRLGGGE